MLSKKSNVIQIYNLLLKKIRNDMMDVMELLTADYSFIEISKRSSNIITAVSCKNYKNIVKIIQISASIYVISN